MDNMSNRKEIKWVGSSLRDLKQFPEAVQQVIGYALYMAQIGDKHASSKPLKGFIGAGVLEVVEDFDGDTYRAYLRSKPLTVSLLPSPILTCFSN